MSSLIDNDDEFTRDERELTLSTGAILGIFLGLVLLCGLFFGFGYKMGSRRSTQLTEAEALPPAAAPAAPATNFNDFKPAPGSPASPSSSTTVVVHGASERASSSTTPAPPGVESHTAPTASAAGALRSAPAPIVRAAPPSGASLASSLAAGPAAAAPGSFLVQVAAVSLQEDADLLAGALRSKGYAVSVRAEPDKLIHIQVGPFGNRKDAEAMRQRLLSDGYNAIVK